MENLKCDEDGCDYEGEEPEYGSHLIGKPCPKCGADLLTKEDFENGEPMRLMVKALIAAGMAFDTDADTSQMESPLSLKINSHKGRTRIGIEPIDKEEG